MATNEIPILGSKSVHCINEEQMEEATRLADHDATSSPIIQHYLQEIQLKLSRNEQAALAFKLIEVLKNGV